MITLESVELFLTKNKLVLSRREEKKLHSFLKESEPNKKFSYFIEGIFSPLEKVGLFAQYEEGWSYIETALLENYTHHLLATNNINSIAISIANVLLAPSLWLTPQLLTLIQLILETYGGLTKKQINKEILIIQQSVYQSLRCIIETCLTQETCDASLFDIFHKVLILVDAFSLLKRRNPDHYRVDYFDQEIMMQKKQLYTLMAIRYQMARNVEKATECLQIAFGKTVPERLIVFFNPETTEEQLQHLFNWIRTQPLCVDQEDRFWERIPDRFFTEACSIAELNEYLQQANLQLTTELREKISNLLLQYHNEVFLKKKPCNLEMALDTIPSDATFNRIIYSQCMPCATKLVLFKLLVSLVPLTQVCIYNMLKTIVDNRQEYEKISSFEKNLICTLMKLCLSWCLDHYDALEACARIEALQPGDSADTTFNSTSSDGGDGEHSVLFGEEMDDSDDGLDDLLSPARTVSAAHEHPPVLNLEPAPIVDHIPTPPPVEAVNSDSAWYPQTHFGLGLRHRRVFCSPDEGCSKMQIEQHEPKTAGPS